MVYIRSVCVQEEDIATERLEGGHRCGRGNGDKLHLVAGAREISWEQVETYVVVYDQTPRQLAQIELWIWSGDEL